MPPKFSLFNLLIIVLSMYVLAALVVDLLVTLPPETQRLLEYIDFGICIVFLIDFIVRFTAADNKWRFMRWGWIDLLSSIPAVDALRPGRAIRLVRLLRLLRAFRSARLLFLFLFRNKVQGTFTSVSIIAVLMVIGSAIAILEVERVPGANIRTAGDAIWWAYVTITTVGYGDKYPVTTEGRLIAAALMTVGVGLFGTFTAYVASWFVEEKKEEENIEQGTRREEGREV